MPDYPPDRKPPDRAKSPCPYCGKNPILVTGEDVYPHRPDLRDRSFWMCRGCRAYVGCHPNTDHPLGTLANAGLRKLRTRVHFLFDPLWKDGRMRRGDAYRVLRHALGLSKNDCHVSKFDDGQCQMAIDFLEKYRQSQSTETKPRK